MGVARCSRVGIVVWGVGCGLVEVDPSQPAEGDPIVSGSYDGPVPEAPSTDSPTATPEEPTLADEPPNNFSFVLPGQLAGSGRPGVGLYHSLAGDLRWMAEVEAVDLLVSLDESGVGADDLAEAGLAGLHLPIEDYHAPTQDQIDTFVAAVQDALAQEQTVAVHCYAGLGRTGTLLTAYWIATTGLSVNDALAEVRALRPGSVETSAQRAALEVYAARLAEVREDTTP